MQIRELVAHLGSVSVDGSAKGASTGASSTNGTAGGASESAFSERSVADAEGIADSAEEMASAGTSLRQSTAVCMVGSW